MKGKVHGRYRDHPEDNDDEDDDDDDNKNNDDDDLNDEYGLESGGGDRDRFQQRPSRGGRWGSGENADGALGDEEQQVGFNRNNMIGELRENETLLQRSRNVQRIDPYSASGGRVVANMLSSDQYDSSTAKAGMCKKMLPCLGVLAFIFTIMAFSTLESVEIIFVSIVVVAAFGFALHLAVLLLEHDRGTARMRQVASYIQIGANGFFKTQLRAIFCMTIVVSAALFVGFSMRSPPEDVQVSSVTLAMITVVAFLSGAACSCFAGYVGMWISVRTNVRVASAARRSYMEAIQLSLQGGVVAAIVVVGLAVGGLLVLYVVYEMLFVGPKMAASHANEVPLLLVGYGFGASFNALFMQLGGGIYTKAADVGADLVGKVEKSIPEDDPRNPAVIADLVGDNVGDCAGRGADLFESISAEIVSAMILGGTVASKARVPGVGFTMFPLVVHAMDLVVSSVGFLSVLSRKPASTSDNPTSMGSPLAVLKRGFAVSGILSFISFAISCRWLLHSEAAPAAWWHFLLCGTYGMCCGYGVVAVTTYYTDTRYGPVRRIAAASQSGHATNIIMGIAMGMESTALPTIMVCISIVASYWTGQACGMYGPDGKPVGGLFGTAVATMGMLSTAVYVLSMDFFGPIADNAGGIVEMSDEPARVREITDELDAVGNTTKAATKGYAVGSASLASFLLFTAFTDEISAIQGGGSTFGSIDIGKPEIFVAGFLGAMLVFLFSAWTIRAVGDTAQAVVSEVRRQFHENPGILDGSVLPDYKSCVELVTAAALRKVVKPGLLAVAYPIIVGIIFRFIGEANDDASLGAKATCSLLMFATVAGVLTSLFLNNAGGAWDNAKKLIETGEFGGKNSESHKAAVTGDTVGDPFKDTAGPSLHVLIKLLSTVTLVMAPIFVGNTSGENDPTAAAGAG